MDWQTPSNELFQLGPFSRDGMGSDSALASIRLLAEKYGTEIAVRDGVLFRYYNGKTANRRGYGFPLSAAPLDLRRCLKLLSLDAGQRRVPLAFCLCDERQAAAIGSCARVAWETTNDDNDYVYKRERLVSLSGKKLQKKRNHIHRFQNAYPDWRYEEISDGNARLALAVARQWLAEREAPEDAERLEYESIRLALGSYRDLGLFGGVLYADGKVVAMTLASAISPVCIDVHFEKAVGDYARNGAFAAVNHCFVSSPAASAYEYINREEDMGLEGLRRAKESYDPVYKLRKYYGNVLSF